MRVRRHGDNVASWGMKGRVVKREFVNIGNHEVME
jgi:hypothetical protein